jgi:MoxR-like ATPase
MAHACVAPRTTPVANLFRVSNSRPLYPASRIPYPASRIPHPASRIPYPVSRIPHPVSRIPHPASRIPHPASRIPHPVSRIPHPESLRFLNVSGITSIAMTSTYPNEQELREAAVDIQRLREVLQNVLFGQETLLDLVMTGLLARGHILLEGLPGLGKTELVKALGGALGLDAKRIQFTPDLLPGDITGNPILQEQNGERRFVFQRGPLFSNLVLADEINRASPKTQSALLEAMQERRVTSMGERHVLPDPFFVLATQNPIELEGTYPLPEAQLDRFLFKLDVKPGGPDVLQRIVQHRRLGGETETPRVMERERLMALMELAHRIYLPDVVANYIARLVHASHHGVSEASATVKYGASPRAAIGMAAAARARALLAGRINASFEDVQAVAVSVMQHRLSLDYHARLEGRTGADVVHDLLKEISTQSSELPATVIEETHA